MSHRSFAPSISIFAGALLAWAAGCGSSAPRASPGGPGATPAADGGRDAPVSDLVHEIDGFALQVKQGSWWEYSAVSDDSYIFDTGSGSDHSASTFVLMLGAPMTIAGDQAFPVQQMFLASTCSSNPGNCTPETLGAWQPWSKWKYLSFAGKRIRGSNDGQTYSVLFDANTGIWPVTSTGMFGDFPSDHGARQAKEAQGASGPVWVVQESNNSNGCDDIPGYGTVCSGSGNTANGASEKWDAAMGCIASGYTGTSYGSSGSANKSNTETLVDSSVAGDRSPPAPGGANDAGSGTGSCVDFTGAAAGVAALARAGSAPAPTGGAVADGLYAVTAVDVYGTSYANGTQVGSLGGAFKLAGTSFEMQYAGSSVTAFYGAGTLSVSGATANESFRCSSDGRTSGSFQYSVTGARTVGVTFPGPGYTSVVTYTLM